MERLKRDDLGSVGNSFASGSLAMARRMLVVALVLGAVVGGGLRAQTPGDAPKDVAKGDVTKEAAKTIASTVTRNQEVIYNAGKVTGIATTITTYTDGSSVIEHRTRTKVKRDMGTGKLETFESTGTIRNTKDANGRTVELKTTSIEAGVTSIATEDYSVAGKLTVTIKAPGTDSTRTLDLPENHDFPDSAAAKLIAKWKPDVASETKAFQSFSQRQNAFAEHSVKVIGPEQVELDDTKIDGYRVTKTSPEGGSSEVVDAAGQTLVADIAGGAVKLVLVSHDPLAFNDDVSTLSSVIKVKHAIRPWSRIEALKLTATIKAIEGDKDTPLFADGIYHTVTHAGDDWSITLKSSRIADESAFSLTLPLQDVPADVRVFLEPTPQCQSDDAGIRAKANEIRGATTNALSSAKAITQWVNRSVKATGNARGAATAVEVLKEKSGDCTEHAALSVALLRASGIPARNCVGMVYMVSGQQGMFGYHAWVEAWIGKWVPIDTTVNEVGTSARYIHFGYNEPKMQDGAVSVLRTLGQMSIEIDSYKLIGQETVVTRVKTVGEEAKKANDEEPKGE